MNLALWLAMNAGHAPKAPGLTMGQRASRITSNKRVAGRDRAANDLMQTIWDLTRGYFPGRDMPVARFTSNPTSGAVGWARNPQGQQVPVGIRWDRNSSRALASPKSQFERDSMLRTLLHEWAHNFQNPKLHAGGRERMPSGNRVHPGAEGAADAFAFAIAPLIAGKLGWKYDMKDASRVMKLNPYRPYVMRVVRSRGMPYIVRDQFS